MVVASYPWDRWTQLSGCGVVTVTVEVVFLVQITTLHAAYMVINEEFIAIFPGLMQ